MVGQPSLPQSRMVPHLTTALTGTLQSILRQAGMKVRIGTLLREVKEPTAIELPDGSTLLLEPLVRNRNRLGLADFDPCVILLNNDMSAGVPEILLNVEQTIVPPT